MDKEIITLPDIRLRQKSETILEINDEIKAIIGKMKQAALDWEMGRPHELATALAAVQIGILKRIIIIREDFNDQENKNFIALINPEIVKTSGRKESDYEGCLSVPDYYGLVPRAPKIKIKAKDEDGHTIFIKAEGFLARTIQHEIDHTLGVPFIDRIKNDKDAFFKLEANGNLKDIDYDQEIKSSRILWN